MLLRFDDRRPFAEGRLAYNRVRGSELSTRIVLEVDIGDQLTTGFLDTGMPCVICSPDFAALIGLDPTAGLKEEVRVRGKLMSGRLHSINVSFPFDEGKPLLLGGVLTFVPDNLKDVGDDLSERSFLGMLTCLDAMCFAVDPVERMFYFR